MDASRIKPYLRWQVFTVALILLILSGSVAGFFVYQSQKADALNRLENAEFVIQDFDIVSHTDENVTFLISMQTGLNDLSQSSRIVSITIVLESNDTEFFTLSVPPTTSPSSNFTFTVPFSTLSRDTSGSSFLSFLWSNVFDAKEVVFGIRGTIVIALPFGGTDTLNFMNNLYFRSKRQVHLALDRLVLPPVNETLTSVEVTIVNPFTDTLGLGGDGDLYIGERAIGSVNLTTPLSIVGGNHSYSLKMNLTSSLNDTLGYLISSENVSIVIASRLNLRLGSFSYPIHRIVRVETSQESVNFRISEVSQLERNDQGEFLMTFDLEMQNPLPASFNITSIFLEAYTVSSSKFLGTLKWNSTPPLFLDQDSLVTFMNVTGVLNGDGFSEVLLSRSISVHRGILILDVYGELLSVEFSIAELKL